MNPKNQTFDSVMDALLAVPHDELKREIEREKKSPPEKKRGRVTVPDLSSSNRGEPKS